MQPLISIILSGLVLSLPLGSPADELLHHEIKLKLDPAGQRLEVQDTITLPARMADLAGQRFVLHGGLSPVTTTPGAKLMREAQKLAQGVVETGDVPLEVYRVRLPSSVNRFTLSYAGTIHHPLNAEVQEYARGFRETLGTISPQGIFLSGATHWYPSFDDSRASFDLSVELPAGWEAVSQGSRVQHERSSGATRVTWASPEPQQEIYLVAAPFTEYHRTASTDGEIQAMAFLRTPDPALAAKYLEATAQYLEMYSKLLGAYPYQKFALVENFWETGYGMPSFTLLGPKVIRLPFILQSSYPHEILHNWWGNGVYVDYRTGNWSEGLTAYLADHLLEEMKGQGSVYRQATLQKYADYVSRARDFPLTDFRSRHDPATEAVGYGKALMLFHMLRLSLGDETFVRGLREFYRDHKFKLATFDDLRDSLGRAAGKDLRRDFDPWVTRTGAPVLQVCDAKVSAQGDESILSAQIEQTQPEEAYRLRIPIAVTLEGRAEAHQTAVTMEGKRLELSLRLPARPLRLDVDPEFDLFRKLSRNEIPPALSGAFGAERLLLVLPAAAPQALLAGYREFAQAWSAGRPGQVEVRLDSELTQLPTDRAVWLLGWENRFRPQIEAGLKSYDVIFTDSGLRIEGRDIPRAGHSFALAARHPDNPDLALVWVATDSAAALPGLARKLPHYHKYSYLGFEGDEPTNMTKGRWPVADSPMTVLLPGADGKVRRIERGKLALRRPLATLPPAFSKDRMMEAVRFLADPGMRGRGFGTPELARAADYIAARFRETGLMPAGDEDGSYFQSWSAKGGDPEREAVLKNVVAVLPGSKPEWAAQSVVVGAHYDHLGTGWPDVRAENRGKIHPGADDNASGIAVLLELAQTLAKQGAPQRSIVFVAFAGEEAGRLGSKHYVAAQKRFPVSQALAMVNLDTVGRLGANPITVFGTGTAHEWAPILMGAGYVSGAAVQSVAEDPGGSDQVSFIEAGVPAVQLFSGANLDYHRPTDTADKLDPQGMVKIASVLKETVEYLAGRDQPLTAMIGKFPLRPPFSQFYQTGGGTRVSLGTIPDFAFTGEGVRLTGTVPGSPAERAGLKSGDVLVQINDTPVKTLRELSQLLKSLHPGDQVSLRYLRDGKLQRAPAALVAR